MNAITFLRSVETMGARQFRKNLDHFLRSPSQPFRIMLLNRPAFAVLPDDDFLQVLEVFQELKNEGILKRVKRKLERAHRKRQAWFWSKSWQKKERQADRDIKKGRIFKAHSVAEFIHQLDA